MEIDNLKNKIGFQVGFIVYSGKDPEKAIEANVLRLGEVPPCTNVEL